MTDEPQADRLRALAARVVEVVGGIPAVRTLVAVLETYDLAGGGLMASGLAYAALFALVPGALLVAGGVGLFITDPAVQERLVDLVATAVPPLEEIVRTALASVAAGAVPTSIVALVGLLWGSSRFYAALDYAFSRVFHGEPRRNEIVRTARGVLVTFLFVALPIAALVFGSIASWFLDLAPADSAIRGLAATLVSIATPIGSFLLFVVVVSLVYRFVPPQRPPMRALLRPAILVGLFLAAFTQLFAFIAPRMVGYAALFGAFVAVFALLAWLSISFNMLILGASWTRVRALAMAQPDARPTTDAGPVVVDRAGDGAAVATLEGTESAG